MFDYSWARDLDEIVAMVRVVVQNYSHDFINANSYYLYVNFFVCFDDLYTVFVV